MSTGLAITALAAFTVFSILVLTNLMFNISPNGYFQGMTGIEMLISFTPLAISLYFAFGSHKINTNCKSLVFSMIRLGKRL